METQFVYNLIAFCPQHIAAWSKVRQRELVSTNLSPLEREMYREFIKSQPKDPYLNIGKSYRGSWLNKDELLEIIQRCAVSIHEYFYDYLLIETHIVGMLDACCFGGDEEGEIWMKITYDKYAVDDDDSYYTTGRYEGVDKPECFVQTCSFT